MHKYKYSNKRWAKQEDNYIRKNYTRMVVSDIAKQLGRSEKATRTRIERLNCRLAHLKRNSQWTDREIRIIKENMGKKVSEFSKLLPQRSVSSIYNKSIQLGIKRKKKRGWYLDSYGRKYIYIRHGKSVAEHRFIYEKHIGRKLKRTEHIHHINCNKTDNRVENLYLFTDVNNHLVCHRSIEKIIEKLMEKSAVIFNRNTGRYEI